MPVQPFPAGFRTAEIATNGATIHTRTGGQGPAILMLHGFGDTGDMWAPLAAAMGDGYMADELRFVATDVTSAVIANSGHWLMEEQPAATMAAIRAFLGKKG